MIGLREIVYRYKDKCILARKAYETIRHAMLLQYRKLNVAMFHTARCGSTVLGNMLGKHSSVHWASELLTHFGTMYPDLEPERRAFRKVIGESQLITNKSVFGFEINYLPGQQLMGCAISMQLGDYLPLLSTMGFTKFIVLRRRNYLRRAVSIEVARVRDLWHTSSPVERPTKIALRNIEEMPEWFGTMDRQRDLLIGLLPEQETLLLNYEDHIRDGPLEAYILVTKFLNIEPEPISPDMHRTNAFPLRDVVSNYSEVESALTGTPYEWMLTDDSCEAETNRLYPGG